MSARLAPSALLLSCALGALSACAPVSPSGSEASVGASNPGVTAGASATTAPVALSPAIRSQDFCAAMQAVQDADAATTTATTTLQTVAAAATTATDPAAITALNDWGNAILGAVTVLAAQYELAKTASGDATIMEALDLQIRLNDVYSIPVGEAARDATDLEAFGTTATTITESGEYTAVAAQVATTVGTLDSYTLTTCGFAFLDAAE